MVNFYITQMKLGNIKLDDVPDRFRDQVKAVLNDTEFHLAEK